MYNISFVHSVNVKFDKEVVTSQRCLCFSTSFLSHMSGTFSLPIKKYLLFLWDRIFSVETSKAM